MKYKLSLLRFSALILFALLVRTENLSGQNYFGFIPNGLSGWPDTIPRGDSLIVGGWLKNYSTATFSDSLYIEGTVDTGSGPMSFSFDFTYLYSTFSLPPGDSGFMLLPFRFDTTSFGPAPQFHVGNNVVVVWPIGVGPGSFQPADSLELNVFVIDTFNSTGPEYPPNHVRIYPVPANGPLYVNSFHAQYQITQIVVRDAAGQTIYQSNNASGPIDTQSWAPGLYIIEATLSNGEVSYSKVLRQ